MNLKNGMKVFADCEINSDRLTKNKRYTIIETTNRDDLFYIKNDFGDKIPCVLNGCSWLKGGNWQIDYDTRHFFQIPLKSSRKKAIQNHRKNNTNYTSDSAYILALIDADMGLKREPTKNEKLVVEAFKNFENWGDGNCKNK